MNNHGQQRHAVIPVDGKCRQFVRTQIVQPFFCQLYLLDFHTPAPAVPTAPSHNGQQEIGIQCFLDDFLKEMNLSRKMRTMNNETLDGMCLTHAIHTTCAVAESRV